MAKDRFQCFTDAGGDLCFNGGVCQIRPDNVTQFCSCPDPWGPDNVMFHQDNGLIYIANNVRIKCAMPRPALLVLFIVNLVVAVLILIAFYRVRGKAKGKALRILNIANIAVILFAAEMLAIYLENGFFTATAVVVTFVIPAFLWWALEVSEIVAVPVFSIRKDLQTKVRRTIRLIVYTSVVLNVSSSIALAATAHMESRTFNIVMFIYVIGQILSIFTVSGFVTHYARQLRKQVEDLGLESRESVNKKITSIIQGSMSFSFGSIPTVIALLAMWTIGSAPFVWVSSFVVFLSTPASLATSTLGIFKQYEEHNSSKSKLVVGDLKSSNEEKPVTSPVQTSSAVDVRPLES